MKCLKIEGVDVEIFGNTASLTWRDENGEMRDIFVRGDIVDMLLRVHHAVTSVVTSAEQAANARIPYALTLPRVPDVLSLTERG